MAMLMIMIMTMVVMMMILRRMMMMMVMKVSNCLEVFSIKQLLDIVVLSDRIQFAKVFVPLLCIFVAPLLQF